MEKKKSIRWSKFLSRRWIAFAASTAALFFGRLEGWQWLVFALTFIGAMTFEKVKVTAHFGSGDAQKNDETETTEEVGD